MRAPRSAAARRDWLPVSLGIVLLISTGCAGDDAAGPTGTTAPPATAAPTTTTEAAESAGRRVEGYVPVVGECFDERSTPDATTGREQRYVLVLDCALPHEQEVIAVVDPPGGAAPIAPAGSTPDADRDAIPVPPYPGNDALVRHARLRCPPAFRDHVGQPYELSRYGMDYVIPTEAQWADTQRIGCTVTGPDGRRTSGSARGTNQ